MVRKDNMVKKVLKQKDLDLAKALKKTEKRLEGCLDKRCLICNQMMKHISELVWYCKRCDTLTVISHLLVLRDKRKDDGEDLILQYR